MTEAAATVEDVEATEPLEPETRLNEADNRIKNHVIAAMAASLIPVPVFDLVALTGIQLKMLHSLCGLYEVKFSKDLGKELIAALLGGIVPASLAVSAAKSVPGLGTATGILSMALLGGAATYAIGKVFVQHFESGGTFLNFDPEEVRAYFKQQFEEGKEVAADLKSDSATASKS